MPFRDFFLFFYLTSVFFCSFESKQETLPKWTNRNKSLLWYLFFVFFFFSTLLLCWLPDCRISVYMSGFFVSLHLALVCINCFYLFLLEFFLLLLLSVARSTFFTFFHSSFLLLFLFIREAHKYVEIFVCIVCITPSVEHERKNFY